MTGQVTVRQAIDVVDGPVAVSEFESRQVSRELVGFDRTALIDLALSN